ncbi:hypothetical protein ACQ5SP_05440 [Rhodovulum sp. YNF3179]|uniref:hypothetical protein n=1 Tax=Rhodovulum sp. YNF3179 TaxID=3425127 RepID=UPI003D32CAF0
MQTENDSEETSEQRAEQAYQRSSALFSAMDNEVGGAGWLAEDNSNVALGQNVLREEIGFFGPYEGPEYHFYEETRNRLIAHGRQDTASAFAMARSAFREAFWARRLASRAVFMLMISIFLNIVILLMLWWK